MEFYFNCDKLLNADANGISVIDSRNRRGFNNKNIKDIIDKMGLASSKVPPVLS